MKISLRLFALLSLNLTACSPSGGAGTQMVGGTAVGSGPEALSSTGVVALTSRMFLEYDLALCTGVAVGRRTVLTAAHCFLDERGQLDTRPNGLTITAAAVLSRDQLRLPPGDPRAPIAVAAVHLPPTAHIDGEKTRDDIAILKLESDIPEAIPVQKIFDPMRDGELLLTESVSLFGYGQTGAQTPDSGTLRTGLFPLGEFLGTLEPLRLPPTESTDVTPKLKIIGEAGHSACMGDSGGPAFVDRGGHPVVVGVVSHGTNDVTELCAGPTFLTDVRAYAAWLRALDVN